MAFGKRVKKLRRLNLRKKKKKTKRTERKNMVEIIGCVKGCCKEERNRLFSMRLVNSTVRDEIKSWQEKFGLDPEGNVLTVWVEDTACGFSIPGGGG